MLILRLMARVVRRYSKKAIALVLVASFFGFYLSLIDTTQGAEVSNRRALMSNSGISNPPDDTTITNVTSSFTFVFNIQNSLETVGWLSDGSSQTASDTLTITIDVTGSDFNLSDIDCGDVDIAFTGAETNSSISANANGGSRDTRTNCPGSATTWGLFIDTTSDLLRFYTPSTVETHVATGTLVTIKVGHIASFQDTGNDSTINPGTDQSSIHRVSGTFGGTGDMLTYVIHTVKVSATVAETLTFLITGLPGQRNTTDTNDPDNRKMGACVFDADGVSPADNQDTEAVTPVTTTATTVPFGNVSTAALYQGCQRLEVTTNAGGGYTVRVRENNPLRTSGGVVIPDTQCNTSACTPTSAAVWTLAGAGQGFGISCVSAATSMNCSNSGPNWNEGVNWAPVAYEGRLDPANSTSVPATVTKLDVSTSVSVLAKVKYRLEVPGAQGAGSYTNLVSWIVTPTF